VTDLCGQCVVSVGSYVCPIRFNERMDLDTLPTTGPVPRRTQYAPRFERRRDFIIFAADTPQPIWLLGGGAMGQWGYGAMGLWSYGAGRIRHSLLASSPARHSALGNSHHVG
jgi:hypothetical protein